MTDGVTMFCLFLIRALGLSLVFTAVQLMKMFSSVEKQATHPKMFMSVNKSKADDAAPGVAVSCDKTNADSLVDV